VGYERIESDPLSIFVVFIMQWVLVIFQKMKASYNQSIDGLAMLSSPPMQTNLPFPPLTCYVLVIEHDS
jgi:hypothetical protein